MADKDKKADASAALREMLSKMHQVHGHTRRLLAEARAHNDYAGTPLGCAAGAGNAAAPGAPCGVCIPCSICSICSICSAMPAVSVGPAVPGPAGGRSYGWGG